MTATSTNPASAAATARPHHARAAEFNALLREMHGPTTCLTSTMSMLAPFPAIAALADASVLDLHISLSRHPGGLIEVDSKVRYGTAASACEAAAFYHQLLTSLSTDVTSVIGAPHGADAHFEAVVADGRYSARIFDLDHATTVIAQVESTQTSDIARFDDLASWHGFGPFYGTRIHRTEVFTVAAGACAPLQAIYSTEYDFPGIGRGELRSLANALLSERGLSACERFEDTLLFDGTFGGEAHIAGTENGARLTLVGEFALSEEQVPSDV